jgi:putative transcriptional regulator
MAKRAFDKIAAGLNDAIAIVEGRVAPEAYVVHVPASVDVKSIRAKLNMTQNQFAVRFGFATGNRAARARKNPTASC